MRFFEALGRILDALTDTMFRWVAGYPYPDQKQQEIPSDERTVDVMLPSDTPWRHKPHYAQLLVRRTDGIWSFYDSPVRFVPRHYDIALGVLESMCQRAIDESPWARFPYDFIVIRASTMSEFVMLDIDAFPGYEA